MPDHIHGLHEAPVHEHVAAKLSAYTRWFNARHGTTGPRMRPTGSAAPIPPGDKVPRLIRYDHLNPCRAGMVDDPLAWPFSTHLDATGYALRPVRPTANDRDRFHRYVSGDPSVNPEGTDLLTEPAGVVPLFRIADAVSFGLRVPRADVLGQRGPGRRLFVLGARALTDASTAQIADMAGLTARAVRDVTGRPPPRLAALAQDPRIEGLDDGWLLRTRRRRRNTDVST